MLWNSKSAEMEGSKRDLLEQKMSMCDCHGAKYQKEIKK